MRNSAAAAGVRARTISILLPVCVCASVLTGLDLLLYDRNFQTTTAFGEGFVRSVVGARSSSHVRIFYLYACECEWVVQGDRVLVLWAQFCAFVLGNNHVAIVSQCGL